MLGIDLKNKKAYVCEVVVHLETGMQYVKGSQPDNVNRFVSKFSKDIEYVRDAFPEPEYTHVAMLWSPIVKIPTRKTKHSQADDLKEIQRKIKAKYKVNVIAIVNKDYQDALEKLRAHALTKTQEMTSPVLRLMQIEAKLKQHLEKLESRTNK